MDSGGGNAVTEQDVHAAQPVAALLDVVPETAFDMAIRPLLPAARTSAAGRRYLLHALARSAGDLLLVPAAQWEALRTQAPWLAWDHERLEAFALVVGVVSLQPALRVILQRERLLRVRAAAGQVAWAEMEQTISGDAAERPGSMREQGMRLLERCHDQEDVLRAMMLHRGRSEFVAQALRVDARLARRARLCLGYRVTPGSAHGDESNRWLPPAMFAALLEREEERHQAAAAAAGDTTASAPGARA